MSLSTSVSICTSLTVYTCDVYTYASLATFTSIPASIFLSGIQGRVVSGHVCFLLVLGPPVSKNSILGAARGQSGRTVQPSDFFCANVPWWFPVLGVVPLLHPYATMGTQSVACTPVSVCDFYASNTGVACCNEHAILHLVESGRVSQLLFKMCEKNTTHMRMSVIGRRQQ